MCSAGGCVVDPASRWDVFVDTLNLPSTNYEGVAWDAFGGAPDAAVRVVIGREDATPSAYLKGPADTFFVTFTHGLIKSDVRASDLMSYLAFFVDDEDVTDYEPIGACRTTVSEAAFAGGTQTVECPVDASNRQSGFTLTWHLEQH